MVRIRIIIGAIPVITAMAVTLTTMVITTTVVTSETMVITTSAVTSVTITRRIALGLTCIGKKASSSIVLTVGILVLIAKEMATRCCYLTRRNWRPAPGSSSFELPGPAFRLQS